MLIYCLINFIDWTTDNKVTSKQIDILENIEINEISTGTIVNSKIEEPENIYWSYVKMNMIDVDISSLIKKNSDAKGWIQVNGTNINYPFVQANDNNYYLTHSFNKEYTKAGWIFLDFRNNINTFDKNTIIYGHSRKDKTMFGTLKYTLNNDWYKNTNNHLIKLSTESSNTLWQVFSVYHIKTENYYLTNSFDNDDDFEYFINTLKNRSLYNFNANVSKENNILTLSTCYNDTDKMVIHAKLIKKESN
jgi:sortase B